ncbi:MAG TPA: D-2-hydroxyacid dehydrogenase, partial [Streptomyces sp.]|nr:D-2-hydroxyacid dehydrogenase [Streptomyces sp.]
MTSSQPPMTSSQRPTLLVLDTEPRPRLGRLTGRATVEYADASTLAERLPYADVLLVWDFASRAVRD